MDNENTVTVEQGQEQQTFTLEEVQKMIQSESDKRVSQALKTQQAKFEKQQSEAEKLKSMDETQRKNYEYEKRLAELEARENEFNLMQNKVQASQTLADRNLPVQFVDYVVAADADTMLENINKFETAFKAAVADAVTARISKGTPKGASAKQTALTKEEFNKMTLAQQSELYNTNPSLYKAMVGK